MKCTRFILIFVVSPLFISSIKLAAMETLCRPRGSVHPSWLSRLVKNSLDNQEKFNKRRKRYNRKKFSPKNQTLKLKRIQKTILPHLRDCYKTSPDSPWGATILELLITKPESLKQTQNSGRINRTN